MSGKFSSLVMVAGPKGPVAGVCLGLAILANIFAFYFVTHERFIYYWDYSGYWTQSVEISASLLQRPLAALHSVMHSVRFSDYNPLPVLPLAPFEWLFGTSRLAYILAITNIFVLPCALVMILLVRRIFLKARLEGSAWAFIAPGVSVLLLQVLWAPVLRGYPDVAGCVIIGGIFLLHFSGPFAEQGFKNLVATGLLLCVLVLLRRWYAYWVVTFFPALALAHAIDLCGPHGFPWRRYMRIVRNAAVIGVTFLFSLFVLAAPFALRAIQTDYSDIYSAYRHSKSLFDAASHLSHYFGWAEIVCCLAGLAWLTVRKDTRVVGSLLATQSIMIFALFARTQDFGIHHCYLFFPVVALGIEVIATGCWMLIRNGLIRAGAVGILFSVLIASSAVTFCPNAAGVSNLLDGLTPKVRCYPLVRNDMDALAHLLDRLDQLESTVEGDIYVLASSEVLNSSILHVACQFDPKRWSLYKHILNSNDVDKRDGFPHQLLHARYLVVAKPIQYHLAAEDQRVIGVLASDVLDGRGIGASFERLPDELELDNNVTVYLFKKVRPLSNTDLDALSDEFGRYYPNHRDIFRVEPSASGAR